VGDTHGGETSPEKSPSPPQIAPPEPEQKIHPSTPLPAIPSPPTNNPDRELPSPPPQLEYFDEEASPEHPQDSTMSDLDEVDPGGYDLEEENPPNNEFNNHANWYRNQLMKTANQAAEAGKEVRERAVREKASTEGRVININTDESGIQGNQKKPSKRPRVDGEAREPKRRRVEEDVAIPPPPPAPAKTTTKRLRVRLFILPDYVLH